MKKNQINKTLARQYRNRWQRVAEIERQEQQAASLQDRWLQLNNLRGLAVGLSLTIVTDETTVWQRWTELRKRLA